MGPRGDVVGLLDIAKCLSDAITRIERKEEKTASSLAAASAGIAQGGAAGQQAAIAHLIQLIQQESEPGKDCNPTLRSLLEQQGAPSNIVKATANVRTAAEAMARCRKAALVVDEEGGLVGIFTPKDMLGRVVAKELSPDFTAVSSVMTPQPDTIEADATALEALYMMRENKYLHVPVTAGRDCTVLGLIDVMEIVQVVLGKEDGGRRFWASAQAGGPGRHDDDSASDLSSTLRGPARPPRYPGSILTARGKVGGGLDPDEQRHIQAHPVDPHEDLESASVLAGRTPHTHGSGAASSLMPPPPPRSRVGSTHSGGDGSAATGPQFRLKVVAPDGHTKTVTVPTAEGFDAAMEAIGRALDLSPDNRALTYVDDQKDVITVDTEEGFQEMLTFADESAQKVLKVTLIKRKRPKARRSSGSGGLGGAGSMTVVAVGGVAAALAMLGVVMMVTKRKG
jgi:predicted transcriptional regulator